MQRLHILGSRVGEMGYKERKLTQTAGKCLKKVLHEYVGHTQKRQSQVTKGHYKIKDTKMPCDTF